MFKPFASLMRLSIVALFALAIASTVAVAQGDASLERRLELAKQMQEIRPAKDQVNAAIDQYVAALPEDKRDAFRVGLHRALNYKALEKSSVEAYAETFTEAELEAMIEYYSKPEARSASEKIDDYAKIVYPEIVRMLDQAIMRVKSGGSP